MATDRKHRRTSRRGSGIAGPQWSIPVAMMVLAVLPSPLRAAPEAIDRAMNLKIRAAAQTHSRIMPIVHYLSDVYSPRLTGTPRLKLAQEWALRELAGYGLVPLPLEAWDFGFPGWHNEYSSVRVVAPYEDSLICEVMAWTPSTPGTVNAEAFNLLPPDSPTQEELDRYLSGIAARVKGKIVLTGRHHIAPLDVASPPPRLSDEAAAAIVAPRPPAAPPAIPPAGKLSTQEINNAIDRFLLRHGASVRVYGSQEPHGVIRAVSNRILEAGQFVPTVVMRNEDYGRITRNLADGRTVRLEIAITNRFFPQGRTAYNALAEIPGTDRKDELVMLGAHIDAHHLAGGALDNAVGCAIMMEAMRILQAVEAKPRRTVRIALWSGEEQRVLGSQAYVRRHFGSAENPAAQFDKLSAYLNLDTGSGRIRAMRVFGPGEAGQVLRRILAPLADLGVAGAGVYSNRTAPGSDHAAFSVNGLPGVYIDQDPLQYAIAWHSNLDTYERVDEADAKQAAVVIASTIYHLAMREELLPRFSKEQMPPRNDARR